MTYAVKEVFPTLQGEGTHTGRPAVFVRFAGHLDVSGGVDSCWEWQGARLPKGYGRVGVDGRVVLAHRLAWELAHGERLGDRWCLHHCDNPPCCNPWHLYAGSAKDNLRDALGRGRRQPWPSGDSAYRAKLNGVAVQVCQYLHARGTTLERLARAHGVGVSTVQAAVSGTSWRHV